MSVTRPKLMTKPFADSGNRNVIPVEPFTDPNKTNYASYSLGFPPVTMIPTETGGKPPEGADFNGALFDDTSHTVFQNAGGQYRFDAEFTETIGGYSIGDVLQSNDGKSSYVSLINNNTTDFNSNPDSIGTDWAPWAGESIKPDSGTPIGAIEYFGTSAAPAGYLIANGAAVGRTTYPDLFAAIGTAFGEGDGSTTFNLPDLIGRFAQGSNTPGQKIEAGLPNIEGDSKSANYGGIAEPTGAFFRTTSRSLVAQVGTTLDSSTAIDASRFNPIYGASDTVQPPALTLLPCIKAFDAATNPGLIDITELANEMAGKVDRFIDGKPVRYVIDVYNDGTNWYRKWSDGWLEQGGILAAENRSITLIFLLPFLDNKYSISKNIGSNLGTTASDAGVSFQSLTQTSAITVQSTNYLSSRWYACGQGAQS